MFTNIRKNGNNYYGKELLNLLIEKENIYEQKKKKYNVFSIIIFITYIVLNVIISIKIFSMFGQQFTMNNIVLSNLGDVFPLLELDQMRYILFGIYCLALIGIVIFDIIDKKTRCGRQVS